VELLVALALIALLTAAMMPAFVNLYASARLRTAVRGVVALCHYARDRAVTDNITVRVNFDREENKYYLSLQTALSETGELEFVEDTTHLGRPRYLPEGVTIERVEYLGETTTFHTAGEEVEAITFFPDGRAEEVVVVLTDTRERQQAVMVDDVIGRCRILTPEELDAL